MVAWMSESLDVLIVAAHPMELTGRVVARAGTEPGVSLFPTWMRRRFMEGQPLYAAPSLDARAIATS